MSSTLPRRENYRDGLLVMAALVALTAEILFLLHQMRLVELPFIKRKDVQGVEIGQVMEKRNTLRQRGERSLSWFPLASGDRIFLNDTLLTGPKAWARLRLQDEGVLDLEGETLVRFSLQTSQVAANNVLNLDIGQGIVRVKSHEKPVHLRLKTREIKLTANSEVVLSQPTLAKQSQVQVKKGEVQVVPIPEKEKESEAENESGSPTAAGKALEKVAMAPINLKAGEALQIHPQRGVARVQTNLNIEAQYPLPQAKIMAKSAVERVAIYWAGDEGDNLELSQEMEFLDSKLFRTAGRSAQVELAPGRYFWRIRRDLATSALMEFTILPPMQYRLTSPADGVAFKQGTAVSVQWESIEGAVGYTFELSSSKDFANILLQKESTATKVPLSDLGAGTYFWRVRAKHSQWGPWPHSQTHSFIVKRNLSAPKPKGVKVLPEKSSSLRRRWPGLSLLDLLIPSAWAEAEALYLEFSWEAAEGAASYRLEVAADPRFQKLLRAVEQEGTTAALELPRRDKYYWRIAARDDERILHSFSSVQVMDARASKPRPPPEVLAKILAKQSEGLSGKKKELSSDVPPPGSPSEENPSAPRDVTSVPKETLSLEETIKPAPQPRRLPSWLPQGIALGGGALLTEQQSRADGLNIRSQGSLSVLQGSLYRERADYSWELSGSRRNFFLGEPGGARVAKELLGGEFLFRGLAYFAGGKLTAGAQVRQDLDYHRESPEVAATSKFIYPSLLVGMTWESSVLEQTSYGFDFLLEGAPLGKWQGAGVWLRGRARYAFSFLPVTPELQVNLHPYAQFLSAEGRRQLCGEASVLLLLRFRWDGVGEVSSATTETKPGT